MKKSKGAAWRAAAPGAAAKSEERELRDLVMGTRNRVDQVWARGMHSDEDRERRELTEKRVVELGKRIGLVAALSAAALVAAVYAVIQGWFK